MSESKLAVMASRQAPTYRSFRTLLGRWSWFPLALVLWYFTPVRIVRVSVPEGGFSDGYTTYRGFPFLAVSDAPVISLATDIYFLPLLANWVFFGVVAWLIVKAWTRRTVWRHRDVDLITTVLVGLPVYVVGTGLLAFTFFWIFLFDSFWFLAIDKSGWTSVEGFVLPFP